MSTQTWIVASHLELDLPPVAAVRVQLVGGSVTVRQGETPGVHLEIDEVVGDPLEITSSPQELTIGYATIGWEGWAKRLGAYRSKDSARVSLVVGPGTALRVATVAADVEVEGLGADLGVASASGRLHATKGVGSVVARTVSGAIEVLEQSGAVRVNTVSGQVDVAGEVARADVAVVSGDVRLATTRPSAVLRAQSVSGSTSVDATACPGLVLTVRTVTAAVTLDGVDQRSGSLPGAVQVERRGEGEAAFVEVVTVTGAVAISHTPQPASAVEPGATVEPGSAVEPG